MNADGILGANEDILNYNLFAYCSNDPTNNYDPTGQWKLWNKIKSIVTKFLEPVVNKYNKKVNEVAAITSAAASITNKNINIGQGWKVRIDTGNENTGTKDHIHIEKGKLKYAQNYDGSKHDGGSTKGSPPNSVKKKVKEKLGWDWDGNVEKFQLEHGIDFTQDSINQMFFTPIIEGAGIPVPSFSPSVYPAIPIFGY